MRIAVRRSLSSWTAAKGISLRRGVLVSYNSSVCCHRAIILRNLSSDSRDPPQPSVGKTNENQPEMSVEDMEARIGVARNQKAFQEMYRRGNFEDAKAVAQELVDETRRLFGTSDAIYASSLNNLALVLKELQDFEASIHIYCDSIQAYKKSSGPSHHPQLLAMFNLAQAYKSYGDVLQGIEEAQEVNEANRSAIQDDVNQLALYSNAIELFTELLEIQKESFGEEDQDVGSTLQLLGTIAHNIRLRDIKLKSSSIAEHVDKAEEYLVNGANILENRLGTANLRVGLAWNNVGYYYKREGKLDVALDYYRTALNVLRKIENVNTRSITKVLYNLVGILFQTFTYQCA